MMANFYKLKELLDHEAARRNDPLELCLDRPDPLLVARRYQDESIALICALFAYGNAKAIVRFLNSLDFSLLDQSEEAITKALEPFCYRFQSGRDIAQLFIALRRLRHIDSLEAIFMRGYGRTGEVLDGIGEVILKILAVNPYESLGYNFLVGRPPLASKNLPPYKRWNMYVRWMVRKDAIDMGLWRGVAKSDLIIPLDTHTFSVSHKLGLLDRRSADYKAALLLTKALKAFDPLDPVKYDFALYRIGQEGLFRDGPH